MDNRQMVLREIPKIDELLMDEQLIFFMETTPRAVVVDAAREVIEEIRKDALAGTRTEVPKREAIVEEICRRITGKKKKNLKRLINGTGVVLHTNLGRARLCRGAVESVLSVADSYSNLEYDVKKGARGSRHDHVEQIIRRITGAEAAMVVNNNAAATMLCLSAMAYGKEVIVSRGELVEIGGSFRIPEIMEQSGAHLKEVGTTNKTKISDYERAVNEETAALMKVHTSNYRILGFTEDVNLAQLVGLGREKELPVIFDMGNGLIVDLSEYGIDEPNVETSLKTGIDVILFSGDKLLGGPQAGIIVGKAEYIEPMKRHQLLRALRVDKMTLAALEATLQLYRDEDLAIRSIPALQMLARTQKECLRRADMLAQMLRTADAALQVQTVPVRDMVGGGSYPEYTLPGYAAAVALEGLTAAELERRLRHAEIPIVARVQQDRLCLSVRTLRDNEFSLICTEIAQAVTGG